MDIEWAKDGVDGQLYIVQARPETVASRRDRNVVEEYRIGKHGTVIVEGRAVGEKVVSGRARVIEDDVELMERLVDPAYKAKPQRAIVFTIEAWDVNCQQHITARYSEAEIAPAIDRLGARIRELEEEVARLKRERG